MVMWWKDDVINLIATQSGSMKIHTKPRIMYPLWNHQKEYFATYRHHSPLN